MALATGIRGAFLGRFLWAPGLLLFLALGALLVPAVRAEEIDETLDARTGGSATASRLTWPDPNPPIEGRVDPNTYRIGPGDEFAIRSSGSPETKVIRVGPVGDLLVPDVGAIPVAGLTLSEAESLVRQKMGRRTGQKGFALTLHRPRRFRMRIQGEVARPGAVTLQAPVRASEAIAAAGGITDAGAQRGIQLRRATDTLLVDLVRATRGADRAADPFVFENDVLFVPARGRSVRILGAVPHPGRYDLLAGDRLSGLVELAGGAHPDAAPDHADLTRVDSRYVPARTPISLRAALDAPSGPEDRVLEDGDCLFIPSQARWREGMMVEVVGEVVRPGPYPITEGVDRARDLLLRAGGYTEFAERGAVRIERLLATARKDSLLLDLARSDDPAVNATDREIAFLETRERHAVAAEIGDLLDEGEVSGNALLLSGDRIVVPPHRPIVSVQGEVLSPGYVHYTPGRKLWEYIADAGGPTKRADRGKVRVTIATTGQHVSASEARELRPQDTIWVPAKRERSSSQRARDLFALFGQLTAVYLVVREATK
ncbi:MAG TPA: SLBB domain-containing protein [Candidatus Eisenbacteria bacterium]|nr:SLBB domain-containing protein [Candidatus Eisenbacteria bacterium]